MADSNHPLLAPPKRSRTWKILAAALCCLLILAVIAFFTVGRWLVVEDPLEKAAAIAVLSGRMPMRALEAAKLYRAGYASEVWLTHSTEPKQALASMGIPFYGEEGYCD